MENSDASTKPPQGRSCHACRRRKIRCDKELPCSYCMKMGLQCTYPDLSETISKKPEVDVSSSLQRIETTLQRLERQITKTLNHKSSSAIAAPNHDTGKILEDGSVISGTERLGAIAQQGNPNYLTSSSWVGSNDANLANEADVSGSRANSSSNQPAAKTWPPLHGSFLLSSTLVSVDSSQLHPTPERIFAHWKVFLDSVDPVLKIIHVPLTHRQFLRASQYPSQIPPSFESLMFSIYFASVSSLQRSVSQATLSLEERQTLLDRYRHGVETALVKAKFMTAPDVTTLQALTLFLTCARQSMDKSYIWSMVGLLIRLAMKLSLHRDPTASGLPPFQSEMRRRLWWQICILDVSTAEENDMDPQICEHEFDTKMPANVDDDSLDPKMIHEIPEIRGQTEMLFTLVRLTISYEVRKLVFSPKFSADNGYPPLSPQAKVAFVGNLQEKIQDQYLAHCDPTIPICRFTEKASKMVLGTVKTIISRPSRDGSSQISLEVLQNLVDTCIYLLEYAHMLRSENKYSRWVWICEKYTEWEAAAVLLRSLCGASQSNLSERAWNAVEIFFADWSGYEVDEERWKRLQSLRMKAESVARRTNPINLSLHYECSSAAAPMDQSLLGHTTQTTLYRREDRSSAIHAMVVDQDSSLHRAVFEEVAVEDFNACYGTDSTEWHFDNSSYAAHTTVSWDRDLDADFTWPSI